MEPCRLLYDIFKVLFLEHSVQDGLIDLLSLSLAGDGTPVYTAAQERKNAPVTVWKRVSMTANATAFTASPTVTSAGIPIGTAITLAMIYTCLLPPIRKMTSRSFLSSARLPGMIPSVSFITGFP